MKSEKDLDKPNKKMEIIGYAILFVGVCLILLGIFSIKGLIVAGIVLMVFGAVIGSIGKFGFQKSVEISSGYEIAKAKAITKVVREELSDDKSKK